MLHKFVRSAYRAGALVGIRVRPSTHAPTGVVVVCYFKNHARAGAFAARWATRLGHSVFVRRAWRPGLWAVSLPVAGSIPFEMLAGIDPTSGKARGPVVQPNAWPVRGLRSVGPAIQAASRALL